MAGELLLPYLLRLSCQPIFNEHKKYCSATQRQRVENEGIVNSQRRVAIDIDDRLQLPNFAAEPSARKDFAAGARLAQYKLVSQKDRPAQELKTKTIQAPLPPSRSAKNAPDSENTLL